MQLEAQSGGDRSLLRGCPGIIWDATERNRKLRGDVRGFIVLVRHLVLEFSLLEGQVLLSLIVITDSLIILGLEITLYHSTHTL